MVEYLRSKPSLLVLLLSLVFYCLISSTNGLQYHAEKKIFLLSLKQFLWKEIDDHDGAPLCLFQKSRKLKGSAILLEIKHKDYCLGNIGGNQKKKLQNAIILDNLHVKSLQSQFITRVFGRDNKEKVSKNQIPLTCGIKLETLNYLVTIELGGRNMSVIVDTGSDLTWVQCQPCKNCYTQKETLFNPSQSSSYKSVLCNSTTCQSLQSSTSNSRPCGTSNPQTCNYSVSYGDGSYTHGDLGFEKLNIGSTLVNDFVFGCGRDNKGLFGGASGLMGLGRSKLSLVSQTFSLFGGVFSYCLPTIEDGSSGSLVMGSDFSAYKNVTPISYTNMVLNPQLGSFYFLNLISVSVGGVSIQASTTTTTYGKSGTLIDSGTIISRLAPSVYSAFKAEFLKQFAGFPLASGFSILDTCFDLSGYQQVNIPTIKLSFQGNVELNVDVTGILYVVKTDLSQICLAFASLSYEDEVSIIGNYQQKNQRVVYDTKESKVGFASEPCSFV